MTYRWVMRSDVMEYAIDPKNTTRHPHGELDAKLYSVLILEYLDADGYTEHFGYIDQDTEEADDGQPIRGSETFSIYLYDPYSKEESDGITVPDIETGMNMLLHMYHARVNTP